MLEEIDVLKERLNRARYAYKAARIPYFESINELQKRMVDIDKVLRKER